MIKKKITVELHTFEFFTFLLDNPLEIKYYRREILKKIKYPVTLKQFLRSETTKIYIKILFLPFH